MEFLLP
ncbi:hypothetical protein LINPERHAP2_LOCUS33059 [Linum perenne]